MQIFSDTINFIRTLSFVDIVFFLAVLALMLLIITLVYFISENKEEKVNVAKKSISKIESIEPEKKNTNDLLDLKALTAALEAAEDEESENHNLVKYEEEQEEKAIISYEELLNRKNDFAINYSEEENIDEELTIKKVDLDNLINKEVRIKPEVKVSLISYEKEEAFLKALKTLQQQLN